MTLARQFAMLDRVWMLRLTRRKRAVEDAARACEAAARERARQVRLLDLARSTAMAAEAVFRGGPGCAQALLMRDLAHLAVADANAEGVIAEDAHAASTRELRNTRLALSQEETRAAQIAAVGRRDVTRRRELVATREEEDRWTSPQPA